MGNGQQNHLIIICSVISAASDGHGMHATIKQHGAFPSSLVFLPFSSKLPLCSLSFFPFTFLETLPLQLLKFSYKLNHSSTKIYIFYQ